MRNRVRARVQDLKRIAMKKRSRNDDHLGSRKRKRKHLKSRWREADWDQSLKGLDDQVSGPHGD